MSTEQAVLGRIGKTHGVKGWLRLHSYTESPESILAYKHFQAAPPSAPRESEPMKLEIDDSRSSGASEARGTRDARKGNGKDSLIVHFKGYDSPEAARSLIGLELAVPAKCLPPLEEGAYYWHQLQGLRVINRNGEDLGKVHGLLETGANDVLQVQPDASSIDRKERLIPYLPGSVIMKTDLDAGQLTVDWEADYLV